VIYLLLAVSLAVLALLAGGETAVATANRMRTDIISRRAGRAGAIAREYLASPEPLLRATMIGTVLTMVVAATALAVALDVPARNLWDGVLSGTALELVVGASQLVSAAMVVLATQLGAKALFSDPRERTVLALAVPLKAAERALRPLSWLLDRAGGGGDQHFDTAYRPEGEEPELDEEEKEMLENVRELRTLRVHDSMVPRTEIRAVEEGADLASVRRAFGESGYSRLPVYRESLDRIVGVVLAHDLFHHPESLGGITRTVPFVPESRPARELLFELLRGGVSMAVVLDEFGGTAGIVTVEDLLEELFGEIHDEHDVAEVAPRQLDANTFLAAGRATLEEIEDAFDLHIPEGDYDTVGGYLLDRVGVIPEARQVFEFDGLRLTVMEATATRIGMVRIERMSA
jgi:CBS domain containing-hemolysin-like protein